MPPTMAAEPDDLSEPNLEELQLATGQDDFVKNPEVFDEAFSDSDIEFQEDAPKPTSERRRAQNAVMKAFAARISENVTEKEVKEATGKTISEESLSLREMLENEATINRITNPRDYQIELFQKAKQENIIAVLDTGSGKTHIATLLIRDFLEAELEHRASGGEPRTTFFLVNSVNLVFQQANVLRHGLPESVEGICGAMGASLFDRETWQKHFKKNMVIVCTAEVLSDCLMHGYISIPRINLLVFDEAHHCKGHHPFARVMRDHYHKELDLEKRPRILGITASPVDVRGQNPNHVRKVALDLEELLHSKIATASESLLAANSMHKPGEDIAVYAPLKWGIETHLHQQIKAKYNIPAFQKYFVAARQHAAELGNWGSDNYFHYIFAEEQSRRLQNREQYEHSKSTTHGSIEDWDSTVKQLQDAANFVQAYDIGVPRVHDDDISSKVRQLHDWLLRYYERSDEARCIVFVTKRQTARILKHIFDHIGARNLRCGVLVGVQNHVGDDNNSVRTQFLQLSKFRQGQINCLFATSVAEEGLDIPQCNLVVRFDLYRTMIGYIQSRGRARHRNSKYLHMVESGNAEHQETVLGAKADEDVMRRFCRDLPSDRKILDSDADNSLDVEDRLYPTHEEPSTGAKLTFRKSLVVLHHFAATWPYPSRDGALQPVYVTRPAVSTDLRGSKRGFQCEVILPEGAPISSFLGDVQDRKNAAKCSAAFRLCLALRQKGFLDANLLPAARKRLPEQRNALLALKEKKGRFPMLIKPEFWKEKRNEVPKYVYLTIVDASSGLGRPHQPWGLLTRQPFPKLPSFPIFLSDSRPSNIVSHPLATEFALTNDFVDVITDFTLQIFESVFNKLYEKDIQSMSYWVVPMADKYTAKLDTKRLEELLDMDQIKTVHNAPYWQWTATTNTTELLGKYLIDPLNGGRRFFSTRRLAPHLKPLDPLPSHVPRQNHKYMDTILDYSDSKWSRTRDISRWNPTQPVLEVDRIPSRRNHLARLEAKEEAAFVNLTAYVCPEPLRISNFSVPFVVSCYVLPAVIHRFESYLIALDACKWLDLNISPALALEALTKDSENSGEHGEEQINYKSGMGPNYERLELMGDTLVKCFTSISVFVQQPDENEFEFHVRRMVMLCNQNFLDTALGAKTLEKSPTVDDPERNLELPKYIRTEAFSRRTWYPEGMKLLRGKGSNKAADDWFKLTHNLGDKSIADVCEALVGACFQEYRRDGEWDPSDWDEAIKAVKLFTNSKDHLMAKWSDYYAAYSMPKYQVADATAAMKDMAAKIEEKHGYHFRYPRLCRSAFTHPSQPFMFERIPNYQRLEFLGDALLDMAFISYLFYKYPDKDPQWLTEHKAPLVSNKFLGMICVKLGMHVHIKHNNAMAGGQIRDYAIEAEQAEREARGSVDWWVALSEPPKCLADVVEAYVAAMFVDSEFDFRVVQRFFDQHLKPFFADMEISAYEAFGSKHPTTRLSHILSENFGCRDWRMGALETESLHGKTGKAIVAMVVIHGHVRFYSLGKSGRYARVRASQNGLKELEGLAPFEFRDKYGCRCVEEEHVDEETKEKERKDAMGLDL